MASRNTLIRSATMFGITMALAATPALAIQWVGTNGGGDGTTWSDANNWQGGVGPTSGVDAQFGDLAPNTPQTITLDISPTINNVIFSATGNRSYTINDVTTETLTLNKWSTSGVSLQTLTVNNDV